MKADKVTYSFGSERVVLERWVSSCDYTTHVALVAYDGETQLVRADDVNASDLSEETARHMLELVHELLEKLKQVKQ